MTVTPDHISNSIAELHTDVRALRVEIREDLRDHRKETTNVSKRVVSLEKSRDWQGRRDKFFGTTLAFGLGIWAKVWEFLP